MTEQQQAIDATAPAEAEDDIEKAVAMRALESYQTEMAMASAEAGSHHEVMTLDQLIDQLCDQRNLVGGDCPIVAAFDDEGYTAIFMGSTEVCRIHVRADQRVGVLRGEEEYGPEFLRCLALYPALLRRQAE